MKLLALLGLVGLVAGDGFYGFRAHGPACTKELETIMATVCRLEGDEACTTETKVVGENLTYEKGECKEIEVCKPVHFIPKFGPHYRKREAEAEASSGYGHTECEKETKEICKQVPVKTPVEKEVEICTTTPKQVCEEVERKAPKVTCERIKH
jgi:hypothetical protein